MHRIARALIVGLALAPAALAAKPEPPRPLARYFPREDLAAYAEFDGFEAHAEVARKSAAYRLLAETAAGAMFEDLARQLASARSSALPADETMRLARHAARSGFAVGLVCRPDDDRPRCLGLVIRGAAHGPVRESIEKILKGSGGGGGEGAKDAPKETPGGRRIHVETEVGPYGIAWWVEGDDLAFSLGSPEGASLMTEALDGRKPDATGHAGRSALTLPKDGFTPIGLAFVDLTAVPLPPQFAALGLDKVKRLDYRWGFRGAAVVTVTRATAAAPRSGLLGLFDQPTFDGRGLPPLPPGLTGVTTFSVDPAGLYDRVAAGFSAANPMAQASFEAFEKGVRDATGLRPRDDILPHLGPRFTYYATPARGDAPANFLAGLAVGFARAPGSTLVVEVKDARKVAKLLDDAVARLQETLKGGADGPSTPPPVRVHPLKGVSHGYTFSVSPIVLPLPAGVRPTLVVGKRVLILGTSAEVAKQALALEDRGAGLPADDPLAASLGGLPGGMLFAHVVDARRSLQPELLANLPALLNLTSSPLLRNFNPRMMAAQRAAQMRGVAGGMMVMPNAPGRAGFAQPMGAPGVRGMGGPTRVEIDPDRVPEPGDLRPFLFPSVTTLTADGDGVELTTSGAFPAFNPVAVAPVAVALFLPAAQASRSVARRSQSVNNMKQIGLALHNYHSTYGHFPPRGIPDKNGKPLLSWRVAVLPFIEQGPLYNEFRLNEPWDSPHNKALIPRMPATYALPGARAGAGKTFYRGFTGDQTLFDPKFKEGVGLQQITDGSSNTLGVVEAKAAVVWTRPDEELPFDAANPAKARDLPALLGGHFPGGFNALMLDGSVRFIKDTVNVVVLRALITRAAGEVVSGDSF